MSKPYPLKGMRELDQFLSVFPERLQKGAYRAGLTAAARPVRDRARSLAKKRSGAMAKSVKTGSPKVNTDGSFSISVRMGGKHSFLGRFFEYGVAPHVITAGDAGLSARSVNRHGKQGGIEQLENGLIKVGGFEYEKRVPTRKGTELRTMVIKGKFIRGAIFHPGFAASPFMRPALDMEQAAAIEAFAGRIRDYIKGKTGFTAPGGDD